MAALVDRLRERARVAGGRRHDDEAAVRGLDADGVPAHRSTDRAQPIGVARPGRRVDQPAARGAHLDEPELGDVARDGRLDDVVPFVPERLDELGLRRERPVLDEPEDRCLPFATVHDASTPSRIASACVDLAASTTSGGVSRSTSGPAERTSSPCSRQASTTGPTGRSSSAPSSSPRPRTARTPGSASSPAASWAPRSRTCGEQLVVDRLDDGAGGGRGNGIAAEGGAVVAGHEAWRGPLAGEQRSNGQPISQALGERDQVGPDAELLEGEERARAAHPGLHLVDAEQRADLERELGRRLGKRRLERDHATLAEHGLEQEQRRVARGRERGLERLDVVRAGERDAGHERAEALPLGRLAGRRERPERPPVEAALERHDPRPAGRLAGDLQRRLVRLGARVAEERLPALEPLREEGGEAEHRLRPVQVGGMPEPVELLVGGGERRRRAMPEPDDGDPGHEVEVLAPRVVPDAAALPADDGDVGPRVRRQHRLARR